MQRLQRLLGSAGGMGGGMTQPGVDTPTVDTAEMVYISSLALLKVRIWARSGQSLFSFGNGMGAQDMWARSLFPFLPPIPPSQAQRGEASWRDLDEKAAF